MYKAAVFFDLDGVLVNWVDAFQKASGIDVETFNKMPEEKRDAIKETIYSYEFFRDMQPLEQGVQLFKDWKVIHGQNVFINSATGDFQSDIIAQAKRDWCAEHLDIAQENVYIVTNTEDKPIVVLENEFFDSYDEYILLDDRQKAIDAWEIHGRSFTGMLVKVLE